MRCLVVPLVAILLAAPAAAQTTYYVRTDGGSSSQCTGTTDAPYPGSGTGQPCAWNHPFQALPPESTPPAPTFAGGDTLLIASGSYEMGYGAPGSELCTDPEASYTCHLLPIPDGPSAAQPTRILGQGWDSGCPSPPELWGSERPWQILDLTGSDHVEVACLEITDRSDCIEYHNDSGLPCTGCEVRCNRDGPPPYGDWAPVGLYAEDASDVRLADLHIHGLAWAGIHAARLTDWTVQRVRLIGNGAVGWDGDIGASSSNSGDLVFQNVEVAWNGCAEDWQSDTVRLETCWGQQAGGYGDGIGLADTSGDWLLEDLWVHHNTSDGIDLLYLLDSATVEARRVRAIGNAGNPFKAAGSVQLENALLVANCAYFESTGSPLMVAGDHCRAGGNAISFALYAGAVVSLNGVTITGQGDCLMEMDCRDTSCDESESVTLRNTLFAGGPDWAQPGDTTCLYWWDDTSLPADPTDLDYNLIWQAKNNPCPGAHDVCGQDPRLVDDNLATFDGHLLSDSPAIDAGTPVGAPSHDLDGEPRDSLPDIGAYEYAADLFADGFESGDTLRWSNSVP